jgi:hypothetical protein
VSDTSARRYCIPADWAADSLGRFIEDARRNTIATFTNLRPQYDALTEIDQLYVEMIDNLNQSPEFVAGLFLFRTHSSFRGAVRLSLGGQVAEAYMVLRGCLESALYGLYVSGDTSRQEIWLRRHEDDASEQRVRTEFKIRNVLDHLNTIDSKTHDIAKRLYDRTIDYGGHPNERAVSTQIKTESDASRAHFTADYFLCGGLAHQLSLKSSVQIGICCLDMFYEVFRDRYRILGIDDRLDRIRARF